MGLVIEVDGDVHDLKVEDDRHRTDALESEGLRVIRVRNCLLYTSPSPRDAQRLARNAGGAVVSCGEEA